MQRVIFMNETRLLLARTVGLEDADAMVHDEQHPLWRDQATTDRVDDVLGDAKEPFVCCSQRINSKQRHFEEEMDRFRFDNTADREWKRDARKRFKYVFSESKLLGIADSITKLTKRYRTLRSQVQELSVLKSEPRDGPCPTRPPEQVSTTQAAAKRVYEMLATACTLHTKHHAQFSLKPQYQASTRTTEIKFQIAYRHLSRRQAHGSQDVLWFVVESILTGTVTAIPCPLSSSPPVVKVKRARSPTLIAMQGTVQTSQKRVKFRDVSPDPVAQCSSAAITSSEPSSAPMLAPAGDFCTQLRACFRSPHSDGACIGWLENSSQWKHRVLHSRSPNERATQDRAETLSTLLSYANRDSSACQSLTILQRLQLARQLTTATLDLYATPWMQSYWRSNDIFVYGIESLPSRSVTREPEAFVEVPVESQVSSINTPIPDALAPFVRNPALFNLAVILLELAYEKPMCEMIKPSDVKPGMPATTIDYYAALRLSKEVASQLGPRYAQIVEQCLFCDFGQGTDLGNPALQSAVQKDVRAELDRLADGFQNLLIAA